MTGCQALKHVGPVQPAAYDLTFRMAPLVGRHPGPGLMLTEGVCGPCRVSRAEQIIAEGGTVIGVRSRPAPSAVLALVLGQEG